MHDAITAIAKGGDFYWINYKIYSGVSDFYNYGVLTVLGVLPGGAPCI